MVDLASGQGLKKRKLRKGALKNYVIFFWPPIDPPSPLWSKMIFWWPPSPPKDHAIFERVFCVNIQIYGNQFDYRLTITDP